MVFGGKILTTDLVWSPESELSFNQEIIPVGCLPPACQPSLFRWPPLGVSTSGSSSQQVWNRFPGMSTYHLFHGHHQLSVAGGGAPPSPGHHHMSSRGVPYRHGTWDIRPPSDIEPEIHTPTPPPSPSLWYIMLICRKKTQYFQNVCTSNCTEKNISEREILYKCSPLHPMRRNWISKQTQQIFDLHKKKNI